ncbi:MAG TPA: homoserine dehydrogenase [Longimicrobiales bacterium]|nr:homoserine dehydrogenase [Longimicrobiales bacterium]
MNVSLQERVVIRRVALAGCGAVGSALLRLVHEQQEHIAGAHGVRLQPVAVLVRDVDAPRDIPPADGILTDDPGSLLAASPDLVVEATGSVELGGRLAAAALSRGIPFITASKALIAAHGHELQRAATRAGTWLGLEATVGGGVPLVRALTESLPHAGVTGLRGVLNGTTNFVLDRLAAGATLADALVEARRLGFAEADASRDLDGRDAADKLAILAWLAFGVPPGSIPVARSGIDLQPERLVRVAATVGCTVRLLAELDATGGHIVASVQPVAVNGASPFAAVAGEENLVLVTTRSSGVVRLAGPGAGGGPTAVSLLADMLRPVRVRIPSPPTAARHLTARTPTAAQWLLGADPHPGVAAMVTRAAADAGAAVELVSQGGDVVFRLHHASDAAARHVRHAVERAGLSAVLLRTDAAIASPSTAAPGGGAASPGAIRSAAPPC